MNDIVPGYACSDLNEFNVLILRWLSEFTEKTLSGDLGFKKDYITVPIAGVECGLSGDTTREGVMAYLMALELGDSIFSVVPNQQGVVNRIVVGKDRRPIPGFYLYARQPLAASTMLSESEWPRGDVAARGTAKRPAKTSELADSARVVGSLSLPDLTTVSAATLFTLQGVVMAELRRREVIRTNNPPVGDYAEWLMARSLGGVRLEANSNKSYDLEAEPYGRIQVKARVLSSPERSGQRQASPFRTQDFAPAALVLVSDLDFTVLSAALLPKSAVETRWTWNAHVRGWRLMMNGPTMQHPEAIDITSDLQRAATSPN